MKADESDGVNGGGGGVYQAISDKEERDLLKLMSQCDYAVSNADRFVEDLQKQASPARTAAPLM